MPQFEIKQEKSKEVAKATFHKESDYYVITLKSEDNRIEHLVHKIHAEKLIAKKVATLVKDANLKKRNVETIVTETKVD